MTAWDPLCQALKTRDVDAAFINLPLAMDLYDAGLDISLLMFAHRGGSRMIGHPKLSRVTDFSGRSVLIPHLLTVQHMLIHKFLNTRGVRLSTVRGRADYDSRAAVAEPVPPGLMPEMLALDPDGDIAAFISPDPFATASVGQGVGKGLLTTQELWQNHPCCGFVIRNDLLDPYAREIEALIRIFFESAVILDHHVSGSHELDARTLGLAAEFLGQTPELSRAALTSSGIVFTPDLLRPFPDPLDIVQGYMGGEMGLLGGAADLETFINPVFAQNALTELCP